AAAQGGSVSVTWQAVPGASSYRVQLLDLQADGPAGEAVVTSRTSATVPLGDLPEERAGIAVEAFRSFEPDGAPSAVAFGFVSAGPPGGSGARWQMFAPEDFTRRAPRARLAPLPAPA